jgi:hypothetical protein
MLYDGVESRVGVMTLDGREIIPPESGINIMPVVENGDATAFIVNSNRQFWFGYRQAPNFIPSVFRLVCADGDVIASGPGALAFDDDTGLFSILGEDSFKWLDRDANVIISIPLMSNTMD